MRNGLEVRFVKIITKENIFIMGKWFSDHLDIIIGSMFFIIAIVFLVTVFLIK